MKLCPQLFLSWCFISFTINVTSQTSKTKHEWESQESTNSMRKRLGHDTFHFNEMNDVGWDKNLEKYQYDGDYSNYLGNKPTNTDELLNVKLKCFSKSKDDYEFEIQSKLDSYNAGDQTQLGDSQCVCFQVKCDCSNLALTDVPQDLSTNITMILLSNNNITDLADGSFQRYFQLQILVLSGNQISRLKNETFIGLSQLKYLDLSNNSLEMFNETFEPGIFTPLVSLTVLKLNKNTKGALVYNTPYVYPDTALAKLTNLTDLHMDGLPQTKFGPGFEKVTALRRLMLSGFEEGYCKMGFLANDTFSHLAQLTLLNVSDCSIVVNTTDGFDALKPLQNLEVLDVTFNLKLGFNNLANLLRPLNNSNLACLRMTSIVSRFSTGENVTQFFVSNLPRKLEYIEAQENALETIEPGAIELLPYDIKYIDLGCNRFVFGRYLQDLPKLKCLKYLTMNSIGSIFRIPNGYPSPPRNTIQPPWSGSCQESCEDMDLLGRFQLFLPPNLRTLDMRVLGLKYILSDLFVNANNSLQKLILDNNYFPSLQGPIHGLNELTDLYLRHASVEKFEKTFFQNLTSLQNLFLENNLLGPFFETSGQWNPIFKDLRNLATLDLSNNRLTHLPVNIFQGLDNLERLYLDLNEMWLLNVTVSHMKNLKILKMSHTQQSYLTLDLRKHIDDLCPRAPCDLRVDLSLNPIRCDCNNFEFLKWMTHSSAFDPRFNNYMCLYPDSSYKTIHDAYEETLATLTSQCADDYPIFLGAISATICFILVVLGALVYRFRWNLRYLYYAAYLRFKDTEKGSHSGDFQYDVFLSYSSDDEEFVVNEVTKELERRGFKLHVHGRDFVAGDYITANIVTAIKASRKTLVVLTKNLLDSTWCNYELQMANMESVHTGRPVLVFLLKGSIPSGELGTDLLYHIRNNTYTLYPQGETAKDDGMVQAFWDRFATDLTR